MTSPGYTYDDFDTVINWLITPVAEGGGGYDILEMQRYEPTIIGGTTPSGRAFRFHLLAGTWTLTYRNRTITGTIAGPGYYLSPKVQQALTQAVDAAGG